MLLCPSKLWIYFISTSSSSRRVANVWRKVCGVIRFVTSSSDKHLLIISLTDCVDRGFPNRLIKNVDLGLKSIWYCFNTVMTSREHIWIILSLPPLPNTFIILLHKFTSVFLRPHNSETRTPVANRSSTTAILRTASRYA